MHAAKHDVVAFGFGGQLREAVGVTRKISEADDFVALIVMSENSDALTQFSAHRGNALIERVVWHCQIIFQRTSWSLNCRSHVFSAFSPGALFRPERGC